MKKKKKEKNNLIITIVGILLIIAIIGGSTYAYWSWQTATTQQTNVSVTVRGGTLTIVGTNVTSATMRPTNDCDGAAALIGEATVTAVNETSTSMKVTPMLDVTLSPVSGRTLSNDDKSHLHWALVDITSDATKTCSSPDYSGTFNSVAKTTVTNTSGDYSISSVTVAVVPSNTTTTMEVTNISSGTINSTLTFSAAANATTTRTYRLYVWLDDTYAYTNTGDEVTDPMQDLELSVKWSSNSTMIQE